jgi:hypothetical protein
MTWPALHAPSTRWIRYWRAAVVLAVAVAVVLVGRHLAVGDLPPWGWVMAGVGALCVARASVLAWRRAPQPRLSRAVARALNPADGARERVQLDKRMRLAVKERTPLPPELHRAAALAVAHATRTQPWYPAVVGLFGLVVLAVVGPGSTVSSPSNLLVYAFTAACYLPIFTDEHRIRRAAEVAGAVPAREAPWSPDSGVEMP